MITLKFSSEQEALNSIATYYQINIETIRKNISSLQKLYKEYIKHEQKHIFLWDTYTLLNSKPTHNKNQKFKIYFYHRTSTNGDINWFSDGICSGSIAIQKFLTQTDKLYPDFKLLNLIDLITFKNDQKHSFINYKKYGPYAFLTLKSAKSPTKNWYDAPEILYDHDQELYKKLKTLLKPTIVEFWLEKPYKYIEDYIVDYWRLILTECLCDGVDSYAYTDVPFKNIEKLHSIQ